MPFEIGPDGRMEVFSLGEYKDYIWDLDGTLLDSYGAISGALKEEMTFERGLRHGSYRRYNKGVKVLEAEFQANRCVKNCDF